MRRRYRIFVGIAAVLLLAAPVTLLAVFTESSIALDVRARSAADRVRTAQLASTLVDHQLLDISRDVDLMARRTDIVAKFARRDVSGLTADLAGLRAESEIVTTALAFDASLGFVAVDASPDGLQPIGSRAAQRVKASPISDPGELAWIHKVILGSASGVAPVYRSPWVGHPVLSAVAAPVRGDDGAVVGLLLCTITPSDLVAGLDIANGVAGRELVIVDGSGRVVADTRDGLPPLSSASFPALTDALAGVSGTTSGSVSGDQGEHVFTYAPIASAGWSLYVIDHPEDVLAAERSLQVALGWGSTVALAFAVGFGVVVVYLFGALARRRVELEESRRALVIANEGLAAADRHKSDFLSSMSHELRTPMNAILGFSDLLEEQLGSTLTERQRRYFSNMHEAGEHLLGLINDVLDLTKVEAGRVELHPETTSIEQLLEPVVANTRREAGERGLEFRARVAGDDVVVVDLGRIRQVLYNLTSNALKFTPRGGLVEIAAWLDGPDLRVEVRDTGIGIPADRARRIFERFERVNADRSASGGTGLGLALSKELVELHGGTIDFESSPDHGSTFRVRLPDVGATPVGFGMSEDRYALTAR